MSQPDNTSSDLPPALVVGGSGFVGSHIVRSLVERGRDVRVLVRATSNRDAFKDLPVQVVVGDILDPGSLRQAVTGCGTVFYSALDPRFWLTDPGPLYCNNVDGLVNAMEVALECGVERFVFTSTMGTLGVNPDGPVTEDIPFNWEDRASHYILARKQAEDKLLDYCRRRGLPGIALCVANTYGPQDYGPTPHGRMLWQVGTGQARATTDSSQPTVDIRDVADAALSAEVRGRVGERYIIANEFVRNREFYGMVTEIGGVPPIRFIPLSLAYGVAWVAERVFRLLGRKDYLLSTDAVVLSNIFGEMDNSKARRELDWQPRPLRDTITDALAWYKAHPPGR